MDTTTAAALLEALSSATRLGIFRHLVRAEPAGLVAGELAERLGLAPNLMSFHLRTLNHAGLVSAAQEGRYQRYRANVALMNDTLRFLTDECCGGQPQQCFGDAPCLPAVCTPLSHQDD